MSERQLARLTPRHPAPTLGASSNQTTDQSHETNVPAEQPQEKEDSRVPGQDEVRRRAESLEASPQPWAQAPRGLNRDRRATLPSASRLRKRREYLESYQEGERVPGGRLVLFVRPNEHGRPRLGVTVTRRVGKSAVRNRLRRLVRESFRRHRHEIEAWDLVVNVRASAVGSRYDEIERELLRLLRRARRRLERQPPRPEESP